MSKQQTKYGQILTKIFFKHHTSETRNIEFSRGELKTIANEFNISNLGDILYSHRYRADWPAEIVKTAPDKMLWIIRPRGRGRYAFVLVEDQQIHPNPDLAEIKIPDATPGIVTKYAGSDEQALLTKLRYNRMIDVFSGVTCYSVQNHLRTTVPDMGQVETDELYVGVDRRGAQYVFPIQAKGGTDKLGIIQIEQDIALCNHKFPNLICRAIAAQFMDRQVIALFELETEETRFNIVSEKHYRLVDSGQVSDDDLSRYKLALSN